MKKVAGLTDRVLEATVVGSFTRFGYRARKNMAGWETLESIARTSNFRGQRVLLTGATSGIGAATAQKLVDLGAELHIVGRDAMRTRQAAERLSQRPGAAQVIPHIADLTDLCAVAHLLDNFPRDRINVLIHNAGALVHEYQATGAHEQTYTAQVLAPQLMTQRLLPLLKPDGRVIVVSSGGMYTEPLRPTAMEFARSEYDGVRAYARAKRAQVELVQQWSREYADTGVTFHSMHPGWADTPGVRSSLPGFYRITKTVLRNPAEGADTLVWLSIAPSTELGSGDFWLDRHPRGTHRLPFTSTDASAQQELFRFVTDQVEVAVGDCANS